MKPRFTDKYRYPRGYVRSESTDVAKTWAAARKRLALGTRTEANVLRITPVRAARGSQRATAVPRSAGSRIGK